MTNTFSIQDALNESLKRDERDEKEQTSWHASSLGMCPTGLYLQRKGVPADTEFDERTLRVFKAGHIFEQFVVDLIKEKLPIETQVRVESDKYNFSGYADLVVNDLVYEIKSKHSRGFWHMEKEGNGSIHNRMQLWAYLEFLGKPEGRLLYISKDDMSILEYVVKRDDEELRKAVLLQLDMLNRAWKEELPPPVLFDKKDWRAKYCRLHDKCTTQEKYLELS